MAMRPFYSRDRAVAAALGTFVLLFGLGIWYFWPQAYTTVRHANRLTVYRDKSKHLEIEAKFSAGNPPQLVERMQQTHATLLRFKDRLANRENTCAHDETGASPVGTGVNGSGEFPKFKLWLAEQESRPRERS